MRLDSPRCPLQQLVAVDNLQALLFDLDGTLIDTEVATVLAVKQLFASWNIEITEEEANLAIGRTWKGGLEQIMVHYPNLQISIDDAVQSVIELFRKVREESAVAIPGCVQAIEMWANMFPARLAVVSGSNRADIEWALQKLGVAHKISFYLGAEDYPHSKPHPCGYLMAAAKLGVSPSGCIVFEDSHPGIESARRANMRVVAIRHANHAGIDQSAADLSIQDYNELLQTNGILVNSQ